MKGFIYILKNPSFPDYVKIGYADDVEERVKQLNSTECTPFAFRIYATYEVNSRLVDKKLHALIDNLNSNLRSIDEYNGQKRVREFYAMSAEKAYSILKSIAEINDCCDKLKKWDISTENSREEQIAENITEEINYQKQKRTSNFSFDDYNIPVGAILTKKDDSSIQCTIINSRQISYNNQIMYITPFAQLVSGKKWLTNGPHYLVNNFTYNNIPLLELEKEN